MGICFALLMEPTMGIMKAAMKEAFNLWDESNIHNANNQLVSQIILADKFPHFYMGLLEMAWFCIPKGQCYQNQVMKLGYAEVDAAFLLLYQQKKYMCMLNVLFATSQRDFCSRFKKVLVKSIRNCTATSFEIVLEET